MLKFNGLDYIKIDLANQYGLDKLDWVDRIKWTENNIKQLDQYTDTAKHPMLFTKAIYALEDALAGKATGFIMGLDATASGIQIIACLTGCKTTAKRVNLLGGSRTDVYDFIKGKINSKLGIAYDRASIKKPIMTTFYGSKRQPESLFGKSTIEYNTFIELLHEYLPGAMECMQVMQACWQHDKLYHEWTLPDGHIAHVEVLVPETRKIVINSLGGAEFTFNGYVNKSQHKGLSLAANIVHSVDGYIIREMVRLCKEQGFDILHIHDSIWASPNYMNEVRENYRDTLINICNSNILEHILVEVTGIKDNYNKHNKNLGKLLDKAEYALS